MGEEKKNDKNLRDRCFTQKVLGICKQLLEEAVEAGTITILKGVCRDI